MSWYKIIPLLVALGAPLSARAGTTSEPAAPAAAAGVVNVGTASAEELERLPGIGEKKAQAIVDHRRGHPLHRLEDLTKVKGIGRKTVQRLRQLLTLSGPTTLKERPSRRGK